MYVRGAGVEFSKVCEIVSKVSGDSYNGNVIVHPDARPIGRDTRWDKGSKDICHPNGYGFQGRLRVQSSKGPGARQGATGRRLISTCWHAYGRVMLGIFEEYPHAVITSAVERYNGRDDFLAKYERTAEHNIGSMVAPMCLADACKCDSDNIED